MDLIGYILWTLSIFIVDYSSISLYILLNLMVCLRGTYGGFHTLKTAKNVQKTLNVLFTSRWPGAKSAPVHPLAKKLYLRLWGHFKDRKPPPWASKNGEFPDFRLSEMHPMPSVPVEPLFFPNYEIMETDKDTTLDMS